MTAPADPRLAAAGALLAQVATDLSTAIDALCEIVAAGDLSQDVDQVVAVGALVRAAGILADDGADALGAGRARDDQWRSPVAAAALQVLLEQGRGAAR